MLAHASDASTISCLSLELMTHIFQGVLGEDHAGVLLPSMLVNRAWRVRASSNSDHSDVLTHPFTMIDIRGASILVSSPI
jgi:hypothetical protein